MLPVPELQSVLTTSFRVDEEQLVTYTNDARKVGKQLEEYLIATAVFTEEALYKAAAEQFHVPFVQLTGKEIKLSIIELIPAPLAETHQVMAFGKTDKKIELAMVDPLDMQTVEFIRRKTGLEPEVSMTTPTEIKQAIRRYRADLETDIDKLQKGKAKGRKSILDTGALSKQLKDVPMIKIIDSILEHAVFEGASDIHVEPVDDGVGVRYRVDGILRHVMTLPKEAQSGVLARFKILANLKIDEHMLPQDGRFKIMLQNEAFSFRVSIMPVFNGEKVVLRILKEGQKPLTLDQLGFLPLPRKHVEEALEKSHGMILVTGPTGSGKTTTLYSMLGMLNEPGVNICTIEDPIEYHVGGVNQSQTNSRVGFTFASGLRAFLRQDPDIIMVGEIRDQETAEIAIHAAMTGHQVLSTLHTNDAPTTIPRLADMNIPPFLIAFTVNLIVAQRLVRKVCEFCKEPYTLEKKAINELKKVFDLSQLVVLMETQKIGVPISDAERRLESFEFYRGAGCRRCGNSGYRGRVGIYEVLPIEPELANTINERADAGKIKAYAAEHGMISIVQDGVIKAKQGITSLEEVLRVMRE